MLITQLIQTDLIAHSTFSKHLPLERSNHWLSVIRDTFFRQVPARREGVGCFISRVVISSMIRNCWADWQSALNRVQWVHYKWPSYQSHPHYHIINQLDFLPSYLGGSAAGLCKHYLLSFPPRQDKPSVKNPTNLCSLIQPKNVY